jgi:hypothetical protein
MSPHPLQCLLCLWFVTRCLSNPTQFFPFLQMKNWSYQTCISKSHLFYFTSILQNNWLKMIVKNVYILPENIGKKVTSTKHCKLHIFVIANICKPIFVTFGWIGASFPVNVFKILFFICLKFTITRRVHFDVPTNYLTRYVHASWRGFERRILCQNAETLTSAHTAMGPGVTILAFPILVAILRILSKKYSQRWKTFLQGSLIVSCFKYFYCQNFKPNRNCFQGEAVPHYIGNIFL